MALKNQFDVQHRKNVAVYQQLIDAIFAKYAGEMAKIGASVKGVDPKKVFSFADYPMTNNSVKLLLKKMSREMTTTILNGVEHEWTLANNKNNELCRLVFGDNIGKLTQEQYRRYFKTNYDAMEAFQKRRDAGLQLSDRVWNYTNQFKDEIEFGLDLGIRNGQDAASMARDLKQYLKYPDKLFRRVRDVHGNLVLSKAAKAFHPSRGVYRSSFKNARRLAATETNIAYRSADYERWNDLDFVVGIRVQTSQTNHGEPDICDMLAGDYPKDFKFVGWHPLCRCYATAILKTKDELMDDLNDDEERGSVNAVLDVPQGFKDYVDKNSQRIAKTPKLPYFLRDNGKRDENGRYILKPLGQNVSVRNAKPTALDIAKQRHANRKPEQVKAIKEAWKERRDTITEGNRLLTLFRGIDVGNESFAKLERSLKHGNYAAARTNIGVLADVEIRVNSLMYVGDPWEAVRKFSIQEVTQAEAAIERTFNRWTWDLDTRTSLDFLKGRLEREISVVSGSAARAKYRTWELSRNAFQQRLDMVNVRLDKLNIAEAHEDAFKWIRASKAKANVALMDEWKIATTSGSVDDCRKVADKIEKAHQDHLAKEAAKAAKTATTTPVGSVNTQADLDAYCRLHGLNPSKFTITNGGVDVIDSRLYDAMSRDHLVKTAAERSAKANYVQTSNSFKLNGQLDDVGGGGVNHSTKTKLNMLGRDKDDRIMTAADAQTIRDLDALIDSRTLPFNVNVIRQVDAKGITGTFQLNYTTNIADLADDLKKNIGKEVVQHRFTSVSTDKSKNVFTYRPVQMRFQLKKGQHAFVANNGRESEIVLPREIKLKLLGVSSAGSGKLYVDVELIL